MVTQQNQSIQVSSPKTWDRATANVNIGDYIRAAFTPLMQVVDFEAQALKLQVIGYSQFSEVLRGQMANLCC